MCDSGIDALPCFGDVFDGVVGKRRDAHVDAALRTGAGRGKFAVRMGHGLDAGGGDAEGERDLAAEHGRARVSLGYVPQDTGPDAVLGERGSIVADGPLGFSAIVEEVYGGRSVNGPIGGMGTVGCA